MGAGASVVDLNLETFQTIKEQYDKNHGKKSDSELVQLIKGVRRRVGGCCGGLVLPA